MAIPKIKEWSLGTLLDNYVKKAGGTLTGFLTLHAAPTADLHAATKKYVDDNAGVGPLVCRAHKGHVNQPITGNTFTKVTFVGSEGSGSALFDNANDRITVTEAGEYWVSGQITYQGSLSSGDLLLARINKNGATVMRGNNPASGPSSTTVSVSGPVTMAANDYVELQAYKGGANSAVYGSVQETFLSVVRL